MELPKKIIVEDLDGGFIIAEYQTVREDTDEQDIPIYKYKEYYHDLNTAIREF